MRDIQACRNRYPSKFRVFAQHNDQYRKQMQKEDGHEMFQNSVMPRAPAPKQVNRARSSPLIAVGTNTALRHPVAPEPKRCSLPGTLTEGRAQDQYDFGEMFDDMDVAFDMPMIKAVEDVSTLRCFHRARALTRPLMRRRARMMHTVLLFSYLPPMTPTAMQLLPTIRSLVPRASSSHSCRWMPSWGLRCAGSGRITTTRRRRRPEALSFLVTTQWTWAPTGFPRT